MDQRESLPLSRLDRPQGRPMQLTDEEIAHIARRRQHLAGQEHKFDARGQLRDGHKFSASLHFSDHATGARPMTLEDAITKSNHPRAHEFLHKARYAQGFTASDSRFQIEQGLRELRGIAADLRMYADGAYSAPGMIGDGDKTACRDAASFLDGQVAVAENRLLTGGIR